MTSSKNENIIKNLHILNHLEIVLMCAKFHGHSFLQSIVHGSKGLKTGANRPCQISTSTAHTFAKYNHFSNLAFYKNLSLRVPNTIFYGLYVPCFDVEVATSIFKYTLVHHHS